MKTIGIDARFYDEAGPGRYAKAIVQHLEKIDHENKYYIFLRRRGYNNYNPSNPNFTKVLAHYSWYSFQEQTSFLFFLLKHKLNLLYVPHFNIPVLYPGRIVTAIPDIIMHSFSTEKGTTLPKPYFRLKKYVYKLVVNWAVFRSIKVIVPSNDTISDFRKVFPRISDKKYVLAYEGVDPDLLVSDTVENNENAVERLGIKKPFLLYVSSFYEHKNVPNLIKATKILKEKYSFKGRLVLIGKKDKFSQSIVELVQSEGLQDVVLMPGMERYVTDQEVVALRTQADVYVFPSLKEGFSLTPMEAQAVGLPCAISDIPCHREIYQDSVVYFDPNDPENMAHQISSLINDPALKEQLIEKGYEIVKRYNWDITGNITYEIFTKSLK